MATYLDGHQVTIRTANGGESTGWAWTPAGSPMPVEFAHAMGWDSFVPNRLTEVVVHDGPRLVHPYTAA